MSNRFDRNQPDSDYRRENSNRYGRYRGRGDNRGRGGRSGPEGNLAKLEAASGSVVIIDQFMLGTAQFLKRIGYFLAGESDPVEERAFIEALAPAVKAFGGFVLGVAPGSYGVYRDPESMLMAVAPQEVFHQAEAAPAPEPMQEQTVVEGAEDENFGNRIEDSEEGGRYRGGRGYDDRDRRGDDRRRDDRQDGGRYQENRDEGPAAAVRQMIGDKSDASELGRIFIETRCLVFIDAHHLRDPDLIHRYKELRDLRDDKAARDLLREYGAAVRYGFNRRGDNLGIFKLGQPDSFGLWSRA